MSRGKNKLVKTARVHHATVTSLSKGETRRVRRKQTTGSDSHEFDSSKVDPLLWESARELCAGDFSRIEIENYESLIIFNTAAQRREWRKQKNVEDHHSDER